MTREERDYKTYDNLPEKERTKRLNVWNKNIARAKALVSRGVKVKAVPRNFFLAKPKAKIVKQKVAKQKVVKQKASAGDIQKFRKYVNFYKTNRDKPSKKATIDRVVIPKGSHYAKVLKSKDPASIPNDLVRDLNIFN